MAEEELSAAAPEAADQRRSAAPGLLAQPHRRYNPLAGEWVLVSAARTLRPWQGRVEAATRKRRPRYDPTCYLCPGNTRASGERNSDYEDVFAFTNDFAALLPDGVVDRVEDGLLRAEGEVGTCRVLCFSPRHDLTMAEMPIEQVCRVIDVWARESTTLGARYRWVQVFENRGEMMGASNPHPHGQIWAGTALPTAAAREDDHQRDHLAAAGRRLLLDYADQERGGPRVVVDHPDWLVVVPFWALWPFETMILPRFPVQRLADLDAARRRTLAEVLTETLVRYDNLFEHPFPYSMGWHQAPYDGNANEHWQLHAHLLPPLLRSASVRKFVAGYELLAETQRDFSPEEAAGRLRGLSRVHYLAERPPRT